MQQDRKPRDPRILKVELTVNIGMSVETAGGDWIKTGNAQTVHIGPGYPDSAMLHNVWQGMLGTSMQQASEQIDMLVAETNRKVAKLNG